MAGHLDPDVLADFREGLLGKRRSARIRAHLGTCPTCASLEADLAQVTELLASAPPPRMPEHLVARLENALAAEAAARTANQHPTGQGTEATSGAAGSPGHRPHHAGRRSWQLRPATLGVAAAIAAVLAVGSYGLANLHSGAGVSNTGSSAAGRPTYGSVGPPAPNAKGVTSGGAARPAQLRVIESGTNYLPSRLASQAQAALAGHPVNASAQRRGLATTMPAAGPLDSVPGNTSQLRSCVEAVTHGLSPLLVDQAQYQGRPATIIVLAPTASRAGQIWVTGSTCSAASPDLITHRQFTTG